MVISDEIMYEYNTFTKSGLSLRKFYHDKKNYQFWRSQFIENGLLKTKSKIKNKKDKRLYFKNWRLNNKNRIKKHQQDYWEKKIKKLILQNKIDD